jgi:cytochrome d ubiquinol oxidase subunit I
VIGLDRIPVDERPPTLVCHLAFQLMVGCGSVLSLLGLLFLYLRLRKPELLASRRFLRAVALCTPLGFLAVEAGWVVSEVGRQPWMVWQQMKVEDSATANTGVWIMTILVAALYIGLGITTVLILRMMSKRFRERGESDDDVPYGPSEPPPGTPSPEPVGVS